MGPQNSHLSFICLFLILFQNGCALLPAVAPSGVVTSTVTGLGASEAIRTARGGYYKILIIEPIHNLRSYAYVDFLPFGSAIGPGISPEILKAVNEKVSEGIGNSRFGKPGKNTLMVKGEVININQGTLSCSILVKVQLLDKETGKSQGVANVEGKQEGFPGFDEAASGLAYRIIELLDKHFSAGPLEFAELSDFFNLNYISFEWNGDWSGAEWEIGSSFALVAGPRIEFPRNAWEKSLYAEDAGPLFLLPLLSRRGW